MTPTIEDAEEDAMEEATQETAVLELSPVTEEATAAPDVPAEEDMMEDATTTPAGCGRLNLDSGSIGRRPQCTVSSISPPKARVFCFNRCERSQLRVVHVCRGCIRLEFAICSTVGVGLNF